MTDACAGSDQAYAGATVVPRPISLVLRSAERKGRIRSAERTEVHLIATIRFHELTLRP